MSVDLSIVKAGLAIVLLGLFFNIGLGISFGINEDAFKDYVTDGIAAHPELHNEASQDKIWRYAQRAHFHAGGIAAFCLGLIILVLFSDLAPKISNNICTIDRPRQLLPVVLAKHVLAGAVDGPWRGA